MECVFYPVSITLPEDFAEQLLELEMQVDKNCEIDTIKALVDLYSNAIEYYENTKDTKYHAYKKRLHSLLLREDVQKVLNATVKSVQRKPLSGLNVNNLKTTDSQTDIKNPFETENSIDFPILANNKDTQEFRSRALTNIKSQESELENRVKARKSLKTSAVSIKVNEDKFIGRNSYEDALVDIMGKYITDKITRVQQIKSTYEKQIEEIKEMGSSPIILEIVKQMETSMQNEIDEVCKNIEEQKSKEIARVRDVNRCSEFL
ncbi:hypothetical protein SteCoe_14099 [Stentor coeruleus]|uniref:Uncharacterized protein n=1 Tax=Stentor coeruleus TaxID=5963 RepID=A0A1R2C6W0_9CILI|nr:hypothetical protein SteCoe_14099 [Stentor coeruleus]